MSDSNYYDDYYSTHMPYHRLIICTVHRVTIRFTIRLVLRYPLQHLFPPPQDALLVLDVEFAHLLGHVGEVGAFQLGHEFRPAVEHNGVRPPVPG